VVGLICIYGQANLTPKTWISNHLFFSDSISDQTL